MASTFLIIVFQLSVIELSADFENNNVKILEVYVSESTMEALIRKHSVPDVMNVDSITILILLFLDDGAITFASRRDSPIGTKICIDAMRKCRLLFYTRTLKKESKKSFLLT